MYGTQTGNAERVAFCIGRLALRRGAVEVRCFPADEEPVERWVSGASPVLIVCSNANQGDAPDSIRQTWSHLLQPDAPRLEGLAYAVFGLGDSLYAKFNYMAKMLHNRLRQLGGAPLLVRGLGDESDPRGLSDALLPWLMELWGALGWLTPEEAAAATEENPLDAPLFPLYRVIVAGLDDAVGGTTPAGDTHPGWVPGVPRYRESVMVARVVANRRLTAADHVPRVHHLRLELEAPAATSLSIAGEGLGSGYAVGDALGVYCVNRPAYVEAFLQRAGLTGEEVVRVEPDETHGLLFSTRAPFLGTPMTTRFLVTHYMDLDAVVEQTFFWMLAGCVPVAEGLEGLETAEAREAAREVRDRLLEFADPRRMDEFLQYAHREKRNVVEVLHDFASVHPSLALVLTFATPMRPRYFSIASAPSADPFPALELTVAALAWSTPLRRPRTGLCSGFLVHASPGETRVVCFLWSGTLTLPPRPTPLLCVATGTGIAPVRSLLRQCAHAPGATWAETPIYLFFGCRGEARDYLYAEEWAALRERGALRGLRVIPAFSRDGPRKVYVQHQLGQHARTVASLLQAGSETVVYLCGNAKQMPKDVQQTLEHIVETCLYDGDAARAQQHMKQLAREGRYQVDTWSA